MERGVGAGPAGVGQGEGGCGSGAVGEVDPWDLVVFVEEAAHTRGRTEAERECREDGSARREGEQAGYLRGFALGLEIGFMEAAMAKQDAEAPVGDGSVSRQAKRVSALRKLAQDIPAENDANVDFDSKLRELRALYKLCGSPVGPFRPAAADEGSMGW